MSARRCFGETHIAPFIVATGQAVEVMDLVAYHSATITRAADETWASAISAPSAPTVADGGVAIGSPLTNAATGVKVSAQYPWGEGPLSPAGTATPTANATIKCTLAALPAGALYWNIYVESSAGSGTYKLYGTSSSGSIVLIASYGAGAAPNPATSGALQITQYNFAQAFAGVSNQRMPTSGPPAIFGTPTRPFGNSQDNIIMVDRGPCVIEFDCTAATFAKGAYVGPDKATGNALLNQQVVAVATPALAIGKVWQDYTANTAKVMVEILSRYLTPAPTPANAW